MISLVEINVHWKHDHVVSSVERFWEMTWSNDKLFTCVSESELH